MSVVTKYICDEALRPRGLGKGQLVAAGETVYCRESDPSKRAKPSVGVDLNIQMKKED